MWLLLSSVVAPVLLSFINAFLPAATENSGVYRAMSLPSAAFGAMISGIQIAGLFVDIPVLLLCIGVMFAWRSVWLTVRFWRIILELIPALG